MNTELLSATEQMQKEH